ncbi:hypothetical protein [Oceanithermus sp.]
MRRARRWLWAVASVLILAACGGLNTTPQATQEDFDKSVTTYQSDVTNVASGVQQDLALLALTQLPPGAPGIPSPTDFIASIGSLSVNEPLTLVKGVTSLIDVVEQLPYGEYTYDNGAWTENISYPGDDLILHWTFDDYNGTSHTATLTFNWNYGDSTKTAYDPSGAQTEVPQDAMITLDVDGNTVGYLEFKAGWYYCDDIDSYILEPTHLSVQGGLGASNEISYDVNLEVKDNSVSTTGKIEAKTDFDSAKLGWNLSANGTMTRGEDCFVEDFNVTGGHANVMTSATTNGKTESMEFNTDYSVNLTDTGEPDSVKLSNGYVKLNGTVAVTFAGTLDDSNNNCVPGENVTLTFADGKTTLEKYLMDQGARPCVY